MEALGPQRSAGADDVLARRAFLRRAAALAVMAGLPYQTAHGAAAHSDDALRLSPDVPRGHQRQRQRPRPTAAQLAWQQDELALFVHFGINTFTNREWGDGTESPSLFNPTRLDARQWARAARDGGAKAMVLTAKHHDGFCLWPTRTTQHSVASSPYAGGQGDVVRAFVDACRSEGLKSGLYCSPWDRNHGTYGDSPRYNDVYIAQLTELLSNYGPINEVWFDGANGEGPNGKRQEYDWPRIWSTVRRLQPGAVIFSDAGPDVRWIGNERGVAGETNWSTFRPESVPFIGASGDEVIQALQHGHEDGTVWRPGETDVSIRPGWFYHPAEDPRVKSVRELVDIFFTSTGRNSKLLLNVPPTRDGLLHDIDVARLAGMRSALQMMFSNPVRPARTTWRVVGEFRAELTLEFSAPQRISLLDLQEDIATGQRVSSWSLTTDENSGVEIARGTTIGYRQLRNIAATTLASAVLKVETLAAPTEVRLRLFNAP